MDLGISGRTALVCASTPTGKRPVHSYAAQRLDSFPVRTFTLMEALTQR
jgi:hypothetical protein